MSTPTQSLNPYVPFASESDKHTIHTDIDRADYNHIRCIRPEHGTLKGVMAHLWKKLVTDCKRLQIHDTSDETRLLELVISGHLVTDAEWKQYQSFLGRSVYDRPAGESLPLSSGQDDKGTVGGLRGEATELQANPPDLQSGCGVAGEEQGQKGSGKKGRGPKRA